MEEQKKGIGKLIFELRKQEQITEEELSQGLCSIGEFRKIETGKKAVEKTLLDALLGRMGRATDNFSIVLEKEQYQLYELRNHIKEAYLTGDIEALEKGMDTLKRKLLEENRCDFQFYCKMKFLTKHFLQNTDKTEQKQNLIDIIRITIPSFMAEHISEYYLCPEEISLCCLLASIYLEYKERDQAKLLLENLIACIEKRYKDVEEKVRVYPQVAILLFHTYDVQIDNEKWLFLCQKTMDLLSEKGSLTLMEEILKYYQIGLEEKKRKCQREFTKLEEMIYKNICYGMESLRELNLEYGISYSTRSLVAPQNEYHEIYLLQEMILDYRKRVGKVQSQLGEAIGVEPETVSRYERGKKKPSRKTYQILAEEIGMPKDKYGVFLPVENYILYEKIIQVERRLFRREFINAEQLYLEVEPLIPKERAENKQYCIRTKAWLDFYLHELKEEEKLYRLETAIRLTLPGYNAANEDFLKYHIPSRYEAVLLNNIATSYAEMGQNETAIRIFKAIINAYQKSQIREEYHLVVMTLTRTNYAKCLSMIGDYDESIKEIEKTLKMNLKFGKANMIPQLLYAKGWDILKKEGSALTEEKRNACMKYYQQAYWISGFVNNYSLQQRLEYLYEKDFGAKLI